MKQERNENMKYPCYMNSKRELLPTIMLYCIFSKQVENAMTIGGAVKG